MYFVIFLLFVLVYPRRVLLETVNNLNQTDWKILNKPPPDDKIKLVLALKQNNVHILEEIFNKVSDPRDPLYGQHMSNDAVHALVAPSPETVTTVISWLQSVGIVDFFLPTNDFLHAHATIRQAELLLQSKYYRFQHNEGSTALRLASPHYSVPINISQHLDFISPTIRFPPVRQEKRNFLSQSFKQTTPAAVRQLYNVNDVVGRRPDNRQAVTAFLEQYFKPSDQQKFFRNEYETAVGQSITLKGEAAALKASTAGIEAMLDTEYIVVTGTNIPTEFWAFAGRAPDNDENEPFLDWLVAVSATSDEEIPYVFSTSYGEDESSVTENYADRINVEFIKAGCRGISLLFASGDSGSAGVDQGCAGRNENEYVPQWPAGSPYVTAVGGTTIGKSSKGIILEEKGATLSSGGFSNRYDRPWWQRDQVDEFVGKLTTELDHIRKIDGRAFPDVSALATGYTVIANDVALPQVAGTSCSCPVVAGIVSLLNEIRFENGKSSLGFLNPFFYQHPEAFNDIITGYSSGCHWSTKGFQTTKGWDGVTGLGTPDYIKLSEVVKGLK